MYAFSKKLIYFFISDLHVADFDTEVNVKVKKTYDKNLDLNIKSVWQYFKVLACVF